MDELGAGEVRWRDIHDWLLERGYQLRSRFHPAWKPSWTEPRLRLFAEDNLVSPRVAINYATRQKDSSMVVLKRVKQAEFPHEVEVMRFLSGEGLAADPRNHAVPLLDVLEPPSTERAAVVATPLLREFFDPPFDTMGEALEFIRQYFEGIAFQHEHGVVHLDLSEGNVMMDARELYPEGFHPIAADKTPDFSREAIAKFTRSQRPPKYYIIDFGLSRRVKGGAEGDESDEDVKAYFAQDILDAGKTLKVLFLDGSNKAYFGYHGFEMLRPILNDMTQTEREKRPTAQEVEARFNALVAALPAGTLRAACVPKPNPLDPRPSTLARAQGKAAYFLRRIRYTLTGVPAFPTLLKKKV